RLDRPARRPVLQRQLPQRDPHRHLRSHLPSGRRLHLRDPALPRLAEPAGLPVDRPRPAPHLQLHDNLRLRRVTGAKPANPRPGLADKRPPGPAVGHRLRKVTDTLLLLDGHSLAYRAFFALPVENFATTTGQPTNAVYGFTAMLINVLRDEKPTRVAVAFDRSEPTFRHEQYVEYKAGRTKAPDEFRSQVSLIFEVLDALGIRHLSVPGYEADDIIATLATEAEAEGCHVLIVTGDRDTFQLISDKTTVLYNSRGVSDMKRYGP